MAHREIFLSAGISEVDSLIILNLNQLFIFAQAIDERGFDVLRFEDLFEFIVDQVGIEVLAAVTVKGEKRLEDPALDATRLLLALFLSPREGVDADMAGSNDSDAGNTNIRVVIGSHLIHNGQAQALHADLVGEPL